MSDQEFYISTLEDALKAVNLLTEIAANDVYEYVRSTPNLKIISRFDRSPVTYVVTTPNGLNFRDLEVQATASKAEIMKPTAIISAWLNASNIDHFALIHDLGTAQQLLAASHHMIHRRFARPKEAIRRAKHLVGQVIQLLQKEAKNVKQSRDVAAEEGSTGAAA